MKNFDDPELLEKLAEVEHDRWMRNAKSILKSENNLSKDRIKRWVNECFMPYGELSEKMKEYDRIEARKTIAALKEYFGE